MPATLYIPESAIAIAAHPDDIEFSCSGTMARWAKAGSRIGYVLITSGDGGIADPSISKEDATVIREAETRRAAEITGVKDIAFLRVTDGMVEATMELRKRIVREIRRFKPEVIVCGDPTVFFPSDTYINHPDHRASATAAIDAAFPATGQPHVFQELEAEGLKAHKPRKVYITAWDDKATTFVDISETMDIKIEALRAHASQMMDWDPGEEMRKWAAETAKGKEMEYAEAFKVITLESDEDWELSKGDPVKIYEAREKRRKEKENKKD
ncbi:MAG: PIG-L family deacetylase [Anaerolineae bacterium]|nr:MAG: PIG-L family deacetylase [Anaerolineae bacterium]